MDIQILKDNIGKFGVVNYGHTAFRKILHGKIKYVTDDGLVFFKTTVRKEIRIPAKDINSFEEEEMHPEVTKHNKKDVKWDGGILIYIKSGEEVTNLKR